jgi:hypothetical protein
MRCAAVWPFMISKLTFGDIALALDEVRNNEAVQPGERWAPAGIADALSCVGSCDPVDDRVGKRKPLDGIGDGKIRLR